MKPPIKSLQDLKPMASDPGNRVYQPPSPRVSRQKKGVTLTPEQKAAFLASRPDLKS